MSGVIWSIRGGNDAVADFIGSHVRPDRPCLMAVAGGRTPRRILADLSERNLA